MERWNHKYIGLVDENEEVVIPIEYDEVYDYCNFDIELYRGLSTDEEEEDDDDVDYYYDYDDDNPPCRIAIVVKKDGKYGLLSRDNEVMVPLECNDFYHGSDYFFFSKDGKWGLFDEEGEQILPFEYDDIDRKTGEGNFVVMKGGKYGVVDWEQNLIIPLKYAKLNFAGESFLVAKKNESSLSGMIDLSEKEIFPFIYSKIEPALNEGNFIVATDDLKHGVVDKNNNVVIPLKYGNFKRLNSELYLVGSMFDSSIMGVLDTLGNTVIPFEYQKIREPINGLWWVSKDGNNYGFVNNENKIVVPFTYTNYGLISGTMLVLREVSGKKWAFLNTKGEQLTKYRYDHFDYSHSTKQMILGREGKFGLVNNDLSNVLPFDYDSLEFTSSIIFEAGYMDLLIAKKNGKWGYISNMSKVVVPFIYEDAIKLSDETRAYLHDGKWTIINNFGKIATTETFDEILEKNIRYFIVRKNNFYGIINQWGDIMDSIKYEKVRENSFGDYEIKADGKWGVMTIPLTGMKRLALSVPCEYDSIVETRNADREMDGYFIRKNGKWGKLDANYNIEIPCEYDDLDGISNQSFVYKVKSGGKLGVLDKSGKPLSDCIYDEIIEDDAKISNHIRLLFRKDKEWTTKDFSN